jgi:hypothetical protein
MTADTSKITGQVRHPAITSASILCHIHGVGWSIGLAPTIVYMIRTGRFVRLHPRWVSSGP